jgi:hypothetical protein
MVSGPVSSPVAVSFSRSSTTRSTTSAATAAGSCGVAGPWLVRGIALAAVAGQQLIEPGLGDAALGGDVTNGSVLDHHSGDQQSGKRHGRRLEPADPSVRDLPQHQSGVS